MSILGLNFIGQTTILVLELWVKVLFLSSNYQLWQFNPLCCEYISMLTMTCLTTMAWSKLDLGSIFLGCCWRCSHVRLLPFLPTLTSIQITLLFLVNLITNFLLLFSDFSRNDYFPCHQYATKVNAVMVTLQLRVALEESPSEVI